MKRISIDPIALLFLAAIVYFRSFKEILALILAALVHELGHAAALALMGERITTVRFEKSGLAMEYSGTSSAIEEIIAALMGPAAGIIYAILCLLFSNGEHGFWHNSADMSVALSVYNLLPIPPLDGGRAVCAACLSVLGEERGTRAVSSIVITIKIVILIAGVYMALKERQYALLFAAVWLVFYDYN